MTKSKTTKTTPDTPTDQQKALERQRKRAARVLLKRRRAKSGQ
jgi:hypothetical protein